MTIDNFNKLSTFIKFDSPDIFYFIQILKRKKDNPEISHHKSHRTRAIRTYVITSIEDFDGLREEITAICRATNSRAYMHVTGRSFEKITGLCLGGITKIIQQKNYGNISKLFNTSCGLSESRVKPHYWVVDIDSKIQEDMPEVWQEIRSLGGDVVSKVETVNGYHLITTPFNRLKFNNVIDVHPNNPTLLYYSNE